MLQYIQATSDVEPCNFVHYSEIQPSLSAEVSSVVDSCTKNKVVLKGILSTPINYSGSILQTLNMKIRSVYSGSLDSSFNKSILILIFMVNMLNMYNPIFTFLNPRYVINQSWCH